MALQYDREAAKRIVEIEKMRLAELNGGNLAFYNVAKRVIDVTGALFGLLLLSPVLATVAILIKLDDPKSPVLFSQTRIGKHGKPFRMYKFRSMVPDAEQKLAELLDRNEIKGAMFKIKEDPRVTRIGRFIRRTSIDELPQLINVLKGEMSLVGPRPPLPREVAEYTEYDKLRLTVNAGCTGLWQVNGRNRLSFEQMVELDLEYIRHRSIWGDLKIIFRTFKLLLGAKDAF
ncbi:sugar transferase [Cohnella thermotolerans]|jgi:exopolysaccharide biosynthesis polyprenyl glycosylphosphotransferase|uniref:sugar transferase n=1 Tax=Cohnella thermotolerans TaxID=329858 RepID=UPI00040E89E6|nr:sugar transferase [Cohnella thermotolerans]